LKIEKAIGREASLLRKVEELQTSFSHSTEREMNTARQLRELKHERELNINRENENKQKLKELENYNSILDKKLEKTINQ